MRTVFAIQFEAKGVRPEELRERAVRWIEDKYKRAWATATSIQCDGTRVVPIVGHEVTCSFNDLPGGEFLELNWVHPGEPSSDIRWNIDLTSATTTSGLECSVTVRVSSATFVIRPLGPLFVRAPGVVANLLKTCVCRIGKYRIPTAFSKIGAGEVPYLLEHVLENQVRSLPAVLVSPIPSTGLPRIDPSALQERLLGLAAVYELDAVGGYELTGLLGRKLSCYNGAVRIFWPGFSRSDSPKLHPLLLPPEGEYKGPRRPLDDQLFLVLSSAAAGRFVEGEASKARRQEIVAIRREDVQRLRARAEKGEVDVAEFFDSWEKAEVARAAAEARERALNDQVEELQREVKTLRENLRVLSIGAAGEEAAPESAPESTEPESAGEALENAGTLCGDRLEIWKSASDSASKSSFARPEEIQEALFSIAELAERYSSSLKTKEPVGPWADFFQERGFKYSQGESETTTTMYGKHRDFTGPSGTVRILRHLTLGGGDRENCLQIYFEIDGATGVATIAYCGVHLPFAGQKT